MTQTKKVTLGPGESQEAAFFYTPLEAKTYLVTINGLSGSFVALSPVGVAGDFEYNNLSLAIHSVPGDPYGRWSEVSCDIKNVSDHTLTMEVAVWLQAGYWWHEFFKQTQDSFSGWEEWAKPSGIWNAGTINLTLAPGETFHFHYGGPAAYDDFNDVYLEDSAGGKSNTVRAYG